MNFDVRLRPFVFAAWIVFVSGTALFAADDDVADLTLKLTPGQTVKYQWTTTASNEAFGRERNEDVKLKSETTIDLVFQLRGLPKKGAGLPLGIKVEHYSSNEKKSADTDALETVMSKGKIKVTGGGKVLVDSENDVGLEDVKNFQEMYKIIAGEMRVTLDPSGKEVAETEGDAGTIDVIHASGIEGLLRLVSGRELKPGQSWEDSQSMPVIASFKLAKPAIIRSRSTFAGWENKNGKRLARVDVQTVWDNADLKGENEEGLVEITKVEGKSGGTFLFDPAAGQVIEGLIDVSSKYRISAKKVNQSTNLDVISTTKFSFKQVQ